MKKGLLFISLMMVFSGVLHAQWQQTRGPQPKNEINCFCFCGTSLFAGTRYYWWYQDECRGGIFKTTDSGINWQKADDGLPGDFEWVSAIVSRGTDIFASLPGYGVYRSIDGGDLGSL
jgi:hypothetical protein